MTETEGVIKFQLEWQAGPAWQGPEVEVLERWRRRMLERGVLGQNPDRPGTVGNDE